MGIAILPYHMKSLRRLADVPLRELVWPLETGEHEGTIRDLTPDDHLVVSPSSRRLYFPAGELNCSISLSISEPYAIHRRHYLAMYALWPRFFRIVSRCRRLARHIPNARTLTLTNTWVENPSDTKAEKSKPMSLIASGKRKLAGHRMRHEVASWINETGADVELLGRAFTPFDKKEDGLAPYRFSVIIENCQEPGYFSEKLMDCLLCNTIPIYWGAPDIDRYFNTKGMVICKNAKEMRNAIENLGLNDFERLCEYSSENHKRALAFTNQERLIAELIQEEICHKQAA
ncbi:MAG: hypothetical protein GXP26_01535 [Planctomycetes bacterium]|nr:hypothetical protein [Planctomycetota bacterium]